MVWPACCQHTQLGAAVSGWQVNDTAVAPMHDVYIRQALAGWNLCDAMSNMTFCEGMWEGMLAKWTISHPSPEIVNILFYQNNQTQWMYIYLLSLFCMI